MSLKKLTRHSASYSVGNILVLVSGFVSFPIFTRIFTVEQYGVLNLVSATLPLLTGVSKLGIQNSIVRYYGEAKAARDDSAMRIFRATTFLGMTASALIVALIWALICTLIPANRWQTPPIRGLLMLLGAFVIVQTVDSCLVNFLRAQQRSNLFSAYAIAKRYLLLAATLLSVFYISRSLVSYYTASLVAEVGGTLVLFAIVGHLQDYSPGYFRADLFRKMLAFGIPMIAYELAGVTLNIGDRYVVEALLGSGPLGAYSAAYNLCDYVRTAAFVSITQAITPMYVTTWEEHGAAETKRFLNESLRFLLMLGIPIVAGLGAVGGDLLALFASEKYRAGAIVIPWVTAGMGIDAAMAIAGAGLFIHKRTAVLAGLVAAAAVLNVALNLVLVPWLGITGAGVATFLCYLALTIAVHHAGSKTVAVTFPWMDAGKYAAVAALMYVCVTTLPVNHAVPGLAVRIVVGALLYGSVVLAIDANARVALRLIQGWAMARFRG